MADQRAEGEKEAHEAEVKEAKAAGEVARATHQEAEARDKVAEDAKKDAGI